MVNISELLKECKLEEIKGTGKLLEIGRFVLSNLSLDWEDTVLSTGVSLVVNGIERKIHTEKWDELIEQCIRATDSAAMSQKEIASLKEIVKESLNKASIDVQKLIVDENYIKKLASDLAGNDSSKESERLSRVFLILLTILQKSLYSTPEFMEALYTKVRDHNCLLKSIEARIQASQKKAKEQQEIPCDVEEFLKSLPALRLSQNNTPFAYNSVKLHAIFGRNTQLERLSAFAEDKNNRFLFWVITGPAGIGKSKLVFHFGRKYHSRKNEWLVRELDKSAINELCEKKNWDSSKNILLIIDYANEQEKLSDLLSRLCRLKEKDNCGKIRIVLIAREGISQSLYTPYKKEYPQWYIDIIRDTKSANDHLYLNEFMDLTGLPIKACNELHKFFAENYLQREVNANDGEMVSRLIENEVLDEDGFARPLYALFVIDSFYKGPKSGIWDLATLQEQIYERDWESWKKDICGKRTKREAVFIAFTNLLVYATIFGEWLSNTTLPAPLYSDCRLIHDTASLYSKDYKNRCFKQLTGKSVVVKGVPILVRLTPDMVGEYYVMKRISSFDEDTLRSWAVLMAAKLVDCKDFFIRSIQDFGNHPEFIYKFLQLFNMISELLDDYGEETHRAFSSILETFFRNYKGNEVDQVFREIISLINQYIKKNENVYVCSAELALLFHENRPHIGTYARISHFKKVEALYTKWPDSHKIVCSYISFLGEIVASRIGAHTPEYNDEYIDKFRKLSDWTDSTDHGIKKAFIPVLRKIIERSNSVHDWHRSSLFEEDFLKKVMEHCADELLMDCISEYDSVIISLAKEKAKVKSAVNAKLTSDEKQLIEKMDQRIEKAIAFFEHIIESNPHPSVNFIWTYVGKLAMITKNLFINQCTPHNELLFQYMLGKLQEVYNEYYFSKDDSILAWRVSRALDDFCDSKSENIPSNIKALCILKKPSLFVSSDESVK